MLGFGPVNNVHYGRSAKVNLWSSSVPDSFIPHGGIPGFGANLEDLLDGKLTLISIFGREHSLEEILRMKAPGPVLHRRPGRVLGLLVHHPEPFQEEDVVPGGLEPGGRGLQPHPEREISADDVPHQEEESVEILLLEIQSAQVRDVEAADPAGTCEPAGKIEDPDLVVLELVGDNSGDEDVDDLGQILLVLAHPR